MREAKNDECFFILKAQFITVMGLYFFTGIEKNKHNFTMKYHEKIFQEFVYSFAQCTSIRK